MGKGELSPKAYLERKTYELIWRGTPLGGAVMKKKLLVLLLVVPILLIPILSCEGDVLGSLSDLMESLGVILWNP